MAKINGTAYVQTIDGVTVAYTSNATLSMSREMYDTTTKSSGGWAENGIGLGSWSCSVEGLVDFSSSFGVIGLNNMIANRTQAVMVFTNGAAGDQKWTGTVSLESLEITFEMEQAVAWSGEMVGTGAPVMATI